MKTTPLLQIMVFGTLLLAMFLACYAGRAAFLTISDTAVQADAVVVFIGPDTAERLGEARRLIMDGYAGVLPIPALGSMWIRLTWSMSKSPGWFSGFFSSPDI